jgi:FkbM family methyltransferase
MFSGITQHLHHLKDRNLFSLVNIKKVLGKGFGDTYYSQSGEDIILSKIFKNVEKGFFVDVGAYHPKHYSNTYLLYLKGWRGINIDPNPLSIQQLEKERPGDINIQSGVSPKKDTLTYHVYNHQTYNTFSTEQVGGNRQKKHLTLLKKEGVSTVPLRDILDIHLPKDTSIDLLSIDAEGMDFEVLKSNNWNHYLPSIIIIENNDSSIDTLQDNSIYMFLKEKGYALKAFTGLNMIFKKNV